MHDNNDKAAQDENVLRLVRARGPAKFDSLSRFCGAHWRQVAASLQRLRQQGRIVWNRRDGWRAVPPAESEPTREEVVATMNAWDRERAPQTFEEVGDYPDPPEDRYDRWEP